MNTSRTTQIKKNPNQKETPLILKEHQDMQPTN